MHTAHGGSSAHRCSAIPPLIRMSGTAVVILVVLLALGNPLGEAILLAILLSCPLMMIFMPLMHSKRMHAAASTLAETVTL